MLLENIRCKIDVLLFFIIDVTNSVVAIKSYILIMKGEEERETFLKSSPSVHFSNTRENIVRHKTFGESLSHAINRRGC